jgi:hypothetical protein
MLVPMSYLQLVIGTNMTDYQTAIFNLATQKSRAYFAGTLLDLTSVTTEMQTIATKYSVPIDKVDDDLSTAYKEVYSRTVDFASRNK